MRASLAAMAAVGGCASTDDNRLYGSSPSNTVAQPRAATYQGTVTRVDAPIGDTLRHPNHLKKLTF